MCLCMSPCGGLSVCACLFVSMSVYVCVWILPSAFSIPGLTTTVQLHRAADKNHHLPLEQKAVASLEGGKMEQ